MKIAIEIGFVAMQPFTDVVGQRSQKGEAAFLE